MLKRKAPSAGAAHSSRVARACRALGRTTLVLGGFCWLYLLLILVAAFDFEEGLILLASAFGAAVSATLLLAIAQHLDRQDELIQSLRVLIRDRDAEPALEAEFEPVPESSRTRASARGEGGPRRLW